MQWKPTASLTAVAALAAAALFAQGDLGLARLRYTVAFWYQTEPHAGLPPLPPVKERLPRQIDTGGPTTGAP